MNDKYTYNDWKLILGLYMDINRTNERIEFISNACGKKVSSVKKALQNFKYLDTGKGFSHCSKTCIDVWNKFKEDRYREDLEDRYREEQEEKYREEQEEKYSN